MPLPRLRRRLLAALLALPATALAQNAVLKTGTWWNPAEPGWGLFTNDQGGVIAPGWFTYDDDGEPTWFLVPGATLQSDGSYRGDLYRYHGMPFAQIAGNAADPGERIGDAELRFTGNDALSFRYTVGTTTQTKSLTKFPFGDRQLVCRANDGVSRATATNYSDLWWSGASGSPGWGVHISHIDDALYATWYTYDVDREAVFMVAALTRQPDGSFSGTITRQRNGTPFRQIDNAPASTGADPVGGASLRFTDGETALFSYTVGTISQTKNLTRLQFGTVANICETVASDSIPTTQCAPPLQLGDTWTTTYQRNNGDSSRYVATVIAETTFDGNPVFNVDYQGANRLGRDDYDELVEQRPDAWIVYQRSGYIAELGVDGTLTYSPPLRIPRNTPLGYRERRIYGATVEYREGFADVVATITYDNTIVRSNSEPVTTPAGTFANACVFDTSLQSITTRPQNGMQTTTLEQGTRREWRHPSIGTVREFQDSVRNTPGTGGPLIERIVVNGQVVEAVIGGRRFP